MGDGIDASGMDSDDMDEGCGDGMDDDDMHDGCGDGMDDDDMDDSCGDGMSDDDMDDGCGDGMDDDDMGDGCGDGMGDDDMGDGCGDGMDDDDMNGGCDDGMGDGGEGDGGVPKFKAGTAEDAIMQIWMVIKDGKQEGLDKFISPRAKGDLAALRNGKLAAEKFDELKQQLARVKILNTRTSGSSKTISLQNEEGRIFRFTCKKENGKYLIREFVNKEPSKSKRRKRY